MSYKEIVFPEVTRFDELLEYHGEWLSSYSHVAGKRKQEPPVEPRYVGQNRDISKLAHRLGMRPQGPANEVGPYCHIDLKQIGGPSHRGVVVRATDKTMEYLVGRVVTDNDHLSFRLIAHEWDGKVLVICSH